MLWVRVVVQVLLSPNNIIFIEWSCDVSEGEGEGKGKGEGEGKGVSMKHEARAGAQELMGVFFFLYPAAAARPGGHSQPAFLLRLLLLPPSLALVGA